MLQYPLHFDVYEVEAYYVTFLGILFTKVRNELNQSLVRFSTYQDLAKWWRDHLGKADNRTRLYRSVTKRQGGMQSDPHLENGLVVCISALWSVHIRSLDLTQVPSADEIAAWTAENVEKHKEDVDESLSITVASVFAK